MASEVLNLASIIKWYIGPNSWNNKNEHHKDTIQIQTVSFVLFLQLQPSCLTSSSSSWWGVTRRMLCLVVPSTQPTQSSSICSSSKCRNWSVYLHVVLYVLLLQGMVLQQLQLVTQLHTGKRIVMIHFEISNRTRHKTEGGMATVHGTVWKYRTF